MDNKDIFTSVVRIKGNEKFRVLPVKSNKCVDKHLWREFSKVLSRIYVSTPVNIGDVICKNILNTNIEIICTKKIY